MLAQSRLVLWAAQLVAQSCYTVPMANPKYKTTTEEIRKQMCDMYLAGQSAAGVGEATGYAKITVLRILGKAGIDRRVRGHIHAASKFCPDCSTEKPMSEFYGVDRGHVDCRCKPCRKAYAQKWKQENRERSRELARDYQNRSKDRNKERRNEMARIRNANNPAKALAKKARRKAYKLKLQGNFTPDEWIALCSKYGNRCLKCQSSALLTVDHIIPISKVGSTNLISNIQPLCHSCNSGKCDRTVDYRTDFSSLIKEPLSRTL